MNPTSFDRYGKQRSADILAETLRVGPGPTPRRHRLDNLPRTWRLAWPFRRKEVQTPALETTRAAG
jgi:hypothetical protein